GLEGYVNAAGGFRTGIVASPLTGQIVAGLVTAEAPCCAVGPFSADRFAPGRVVDADDALRPGAVIRACLMRLAPPPLTWAARPTDWKTPRSSSPLAWQRPHHHRHQLRGPGPAPPGALGHQPRRRRPDGRGQVQALSGRT